MRITNITRLALALGIIGLLGGCATFRASSYGISSDNVMKMKEANKTAARIDVGEFTATIPGKQLHCRGAGVINLPADQPTYEAYIRNAFVSELKLADLYEAGADTMLSANLDEIGMSSSVGNGKWIITGTFAAGEKKFTVSSTYDFSTNWVGDKACQQVAQALVPAVQSFIGKVVDSPEFKQLLE